MLSVGFIAFWGEASKNQNLCACAKIVPGCCRPYGLLRGSVVSKIINYKIPKKKCSDRRHLKTKIKIASGDGGWSRQKEPNWRILKGQFFLKTMKFQGDRSQMTMEEIFAEVLSCRELGRKDRCRLKEAILGNSLSQDHHDIINRLIYCTKRHKLKLRD